MGSVAAIETVDEVKNRIESLKLVDDGEEDRISELPDCLVVEILCRLPSTKDAIRTGTLSRRWKHLWTWVHTLIFRLPDDPQSKGLQTPSISSNFISFVNKTLTQCRHLKLKRFEVHIGYNCGIPFESQFNNWVRCALSCNVEELNLKIWSEKEPKCLLDQSFYVSSCFTDLRLEACTMDPSGAIRWKNLRNLCIDFVEVDEDMIENILFGSPLLETLELCECYGYRRLDITSKSVKNLVINGYLDGEYAKDPAYEDQADIIEINAPNILSLEIVGLLMMRYFLLVNVSSLIQANLDYEHYRTTKRKTREVMLKGLILNLRHVKELQIAYWCSMDLSRLEDNGFTLPSNLKFPDNRPDWRRHYNSNGDLKLAVL